MRTAVWHGAGVYPSSVQGGVHVAQGQFAIVPKFIVLYAVQTGGPMGTAVLHGAIVYPSSVQGGVHVAPHGL